MWTIVWKTSVITTVAFWITAFWGKFLLNLILYYIAEALRQGLGG